MKNRNWSSSDNCEKTDEVIVIVLCLLQFLYYVEAILFKLIIFYSVYYLYLDSLIIRDVSYM